MSLAADKSEEQNQTQLASEPMELLGKVKAGNNNTEVMQEMENKLQTLM